MMENSCNCHKYSKSIDAIFEAGSKHKKAALAVKKVADKQKINLKECIETIDNLKFAQLQIDEENLKMYQENRELG